MAITFYYGSGSAPAWRVWLALEAKGLAYEWRRLDFSAGDPKKPEYLAVNPRGKVPAIVDDGFALWESAAIVEYLDQAYPSAGLALFPREPKQAAIVRRTIQELDCYFYPAVQRIFAQTLGKHRSAPDAKEIAEGKAQLAAELARLEAQLANREHLAGPLTAADLTLYPQLAMVRRIEARVPGHDLASLVGPNVEAWEKRIEALPYLEKTWPPHWKA